MSVMAPHYPIRIQFAPHIAMWRLAAAWPRKSVIEAAISLPGSSPFAALLSVHSRDREGDPTNRQMSYWHFG
jgi:hypothetical protein